MKKDKNIQPEQQNADNGWKPRMRASHGDGEKEFVLDLQQELLMKAYPTRESRAKEQGDNYDPQPTSAGNFGGTRDDYSGDAIAEKDVTSTYSAQNNTTPDETGGEVYTRLAKPKDKTGFEGPAKHVYRKMPGSEGSSESQPVQKEARPSGLGRAYSSGDDEEAESTVEQNVRPAVQEAPQETGPKTNVLEALDRLFGNNDSEAAAGPEIEEAPKQEKAPEVSSGTDAASLFASVFDDKNTYRSKAANTAPVVETTYEEEPEEAPAYEESEAVEEEVVEVETVQEEPAAAPSYEVPVSNEPSYEEVVEEEPVYEQETVIEEVKEKAPETAAPKKEPSALFDLPFDVTPIVPGTLEARQASIHTTKPPKADPFDMPPIHFSKTPVELPEWAKKEKEEKERLEREKAEKEEAERIEREKAAAEEQARLEAERLAAEAQKANPAYEAISKKIDEELNDIPKDPEEEGRKKEEQLEKELDRLSSPTMLDDIFSQFSPKNKKRKRSLLDDFDDIEDEIDAKLATLTGTQRKTPLHQQQKISVNTGFSATDLPFGAPAQGKSTTQTEAAAYRQRRLEAARLAAEQEQSQETPAAKKDKKAKAEKPEAPKPETQKTEPKQTDLSAVASAVKSAMDEKPQAKKPRPTSLAAVLEEEEAPKKKKEKTFPRLMKMLRPYMPLMLASLLVTLIAVGLQLYMPFLTGKIIDNAIGEGLVQMSAITKLLLQMLVVILVSVIAQWLMEVFNNRITFSIIKDIRTKAFNHMLELPLKYIDSKKQGEMINCIMTDVDQISDGLLLGFSQIFSGIITILGTLVFMILVDWRVAIAVIVLTPLSLVVASQIAKRTFHMFQKQSQDRAELAAHVEEMISNQKTVIAFGREANSIEVFDDLNSEFSKSSRKATFFSSITNPSTRFVNSVVYAVVGVLGAVFGVQGTMTIGDISCFLSYARQYTKPFNEISGVIAEFQNALASASRVFDLLDEEAEKEVTDSQAIKNAQGEVNLSHVKFSYNPKKRLITDFNLNVTPGQRIAIVGPTGCGKTTLINLLMRFYDIDAGSIRIDQKDIFKMTRDDLRSNFGMVLQDTWIRSGTIEENIAIGNPGATHEQIVNAAKAVYAHGFIRRMPQGYQTVLSEGGEGLSQGQKQLLCIARVMLKRPPMLILDEATSSIDSRTEIMVQKAFDELMKGRTSFVVAHRLSTIKEADVILVMKDGNVIEQGSHEELLKQGGFYYELFQSQYAH